MLWALQGAALGGGQGANTCDRYDGRGVPQVHVDPQAAPHAGPAWPCAGVCASSMGRCSASSYVRLRGPAGGSGQGHAADWEHCVHLLATISAAEDTTAHSP